VKAGGQHGGGSQQFAHASHFFCEGKYVRQLNHYGPVRLQDLSARCTLLGDNRLGQFPEMPSAEI